MKEAVVELPSWMQEEGIGSEVFESDDFRIYRYKVIPCPKRCLHDWTACPFAHPGEKSRRRCPQTYDYLAIPCPHMKQNHVCPQGDECPYSHNVFEFWLHPSRYRTQMCQKGCECKRDVCFFAHKDEELRVHRPTSSCSVASSEADMGLSRSSSRVGLSMPVTPTSFDNKSHEHGAIACIAIGSDGLQDTAVKADVHEPTGSSLVLKAVAMDPGSVQPVIADMCLAPPGLYSGNSFCTAGNPQWANCFVPTAMGNDAPLMNLAPWAATSGPSFVPAPYLALETFNLPLCVNPSPNPTNLVHLPTQALPLPQAPQMFAYQQSLQMCLQPQIPQTQMGLAPFSFPLIVSGTGGQGPTVMLS